MEKIIQDRILFVFQFTYIFFYWYYITKRYRKKKLKKNRAHSSVWKEWLPAEQLVVGSNPSGPVINLTIFLGSPFYPLYLE